MMPCPKAAYRHWVNLTRHPCRFARNKILPLLAILCFLENSSQNFSAVSQTLNEDQIKAGYLFNFTRFVEWPAQAFATATSPMIVCVVGDSPLTNLLTDAAAGKVVNGRTVSVKPLKASDEFRGCNLLFVGSAQARGAERILERLKEMSVLSVGEAPGFAEAGGVINFFTQDNKVKVEINLDAATHSNLKINAKLIAVSRLVSTRPTKGGN
jgi:hypothetical protein